jgi:type I restriction enzyme S subunit
MDAEFYSRKNIQALANLVAKNALPITKFVTVSDGNHMTISDYYCDDGGVPYYRGTDIYNFFIEQANSPLRIEQRAFDVPNMRRSHLKKGDVLMSIVGAIIGNLSLVTTDAKATCSCKLAIMRPTDISPNFLAVYLKSYYGQNQIQKYKRGAAQTGLILEDFDQILIPDFSKNFRAKIAALVDLTYGITKQSQSTYANAEALLLDILGMADFSPSAEAINVKSFKDSFAATGRLDAEYYQPKYEQMVEHIKVQSHDRLIELADIKKSIEPGSDAYSEDEEGLPFLRVADYSKYGMTKPQKCLNTTFVAENQAELEVLKPKKGTILFSKDGSVGEAYCLREDADFITSGAVLHLTVKNPDEVLPDYLTLALNSKLVKMQAERDAGGSIILHWRVGEIENVVVPLVDMPTQEKISALVKESFSLKAKSERLLDVAKRAVEIAIEQDEDAGMAYIEANS